MSIDLTQKIVSTEY